MKELELLNHLLETYIDEENYDYSAYIELEKSLKALEIIKEIMPVEEEDFCYDKETDTYFFIGYRVSKKQYDLLKEVLL